MRRTISRRASTVRSSPAAHQPVDALLAISLRLDPYVRRGVELDHERRRSKRRAIALGGPDRDHGFGQEPERRRGHHLARALRRLRQRHVRQCQDCSATCCATRDSGHKPPRQRWQQLSTPAGCCAPPEELRTASVSTTRVSISARASAHNRSSSRPTARA